MEKIGTITSLVRYPVKSMAGEAIDTGFLGFPGLFGDRVYSFIHEGAKPGFPWFTIRELEELVRYKAHFRNPELMRAPLDMQAALSRGVGLTMLYPQENAFDVEVELPDGERLSILAPELKLHLEVVAETKLALRFSERSLSDCRPVSIFSNGTASALAAEIGVPIDKRRFRANLYVDWDSAEPYFENTLIGRILQIGERARVMVTERDPRCKVITIDPDTGDETPSILRHITKTHEGKAGVYGAVLLEGLVHAGDPIQLL